MAVCRNERLVVLLLRGRHAAGDRGLGVGLPQHRGKFCYGGQALSQLLGR